MTTIADVALVLAIACTAFQVALLISHYILLAKANGGKVSSSLGWAYAGIAFWILWVVLT